MEYRYTSTEERVYADRGLHVNSGDVVDWPDGPPADGHWVPTEETQAELDRLAEERAAAEAEQAKTGEQQSTPPPGGSGEQQTGETDPPTTTAAARGARKTPKE